jgi:hypothetical protein
MDWVGLGGSGLTSMPTENPRDFLVFKLVDGGLSCMPSVIPWGVTVYKVRTHIRLHHEKKILRRGYKIIT